MHRTVDTNGGTLEVLLTREERDFVCREFSNENSTCVCRYSASVGRWAGPRHLDRRDLVVARLMILRIQAEGSGNRASGLYPIFCASNFSFSV